MSFYQRKNAQLKKYVIKDVKRMRHKIGEGPFGYVEELAINGKHFAGKNYHTTSLYPSGVDVSTDSIIRRYASECHLLSQVHHTNIIKFIGICFWKENNCMPTFVLELLPSNLEQMIKSSDNLLLTVKFHILKEVTKGLIFLHNSTPPFVHRDLTSHNVLLNNDATIVKITDFRNVSIVDPEKVNEIIVTNERLLSYMPPEVFAKASTQYDPPVDIFAFSHLALYTLTATFPGDLLPKLYFEMQSGKMLIRTELERRKAYIDALKCIIPSGTPIIEMVERCLEDLPQQRPKVSDVLDYINRHISVESDMLEPRSHMEDRIYRKLNGEPEFLEMFTAGSKMKLRKGGWRVYEFQFENSLLIRRNADTKEILSKIPLSSTEGAENQESVLSSDKSKYYFKLKIQGQLPWSLRTFTEEKRSIWVAAVNQGVQQSEKDQPSHEIYLDNDDTAIIYESIPTFKRSIFRKKSAKDKRLSAPIPSLEPFDDIIAKQNPCYVDTMSIDRERGEQKRNARDALPQRPTQTAAEYELYAEVQDISTGEGYEYDDIINPENIPPPIPPKLKNRHNFVTQTTASDDEEGYVPVNQQADNLREQMFSDSPASAPLRPQSPLSLSSGLSSPRPVETSAASIPMITCDIADSSEEVQVSPNFCGGLMDSSAYLAVEDDTQGNLSSLEISPNKNYSMEHIQHLFHQGLSAMSPVHSNDGSELSFGDDSPPHKAHIPDEGTSLPKPPCHTTKGRNVYDKLQWECREQSSYVKSKPISVPARENIVAMSHSRFNNESTHETSEYTQDFSPSSPSTRDLQTLMLQKMQQALEAMQEAYMYMSQDEEATKPETLQFLESSQSMIASLCQPKKHVDQKKIENSADADLLPHALMTKCLDELLTKTSVAYLDKLQRGDGRTIAPELQKLARANSVKEESKVTLQPLSSLQKQINYVSIKQIHNKILFDQGQYTTLSTADLRHHGSVIKVLITSVKEPKDKKEQEKFFQQQMAIAELIHPNIARHFLLHDQESPMIVSELLPNGNLKTFLQQNKRPVSKLLNYMLDVSMGMHYLAQKGLVHRNLAARSVIVDQNEKCKITNFKYLIHKKDCTGVDILNNDLPTMCRWMAPESISKPRNFSTASDVWSFGILLWELKNPDKEPYHDMTGNEVLSNEMSCSASLCIPNEYQNEVKSVIKACWQHDSSQRPSFLLIANIINFIIV